MLDYNDSLVFERNCSAQRRNRAAKSFGNHDFLFKRAAVDITDRLRDIRRDFPLALKIGARGQDENFAEAAGCNHLITMDLAPSLLSKASVCADEERLPFAPHTFDLAVSPLSLHTANDLPGALIQIRRALKPDGLFIGALFGGQTLHELRACLVQAETNLTGGVSPRVSPMADRQALAALMQRAGFALPVVDAETLTVIYSDIFRLMTDLRGMGETNIIAARQKTISRRALFIEAGTLYREQFGEADGKIRATFEIITLTGWSPHENQQKPLKRGSAQKSLADALAC